jgi:hypothetical protein
VHEKCKSGECTLKIEDEDCAEGEGSKISFIFLLLTFNRGNCWICLNFLME